MPPAQASSVPAIAASPYPLRAGNRVELLLDGVAAFRRLCQAIEAARRSVWATITFLWSTFEMPDGRGPPLAVLEQAARRGIDVRLIFWQPDDSTAYLRENAFWGAPDHLALLRVQAPSLQVRFDRARPGFCQHQKSWLIDAGEDDAMAFLGGLNLNPHSLAVPGHGGDGENHDLYIALSGPAVADVQRNFEQRWDGTRRAVRPPPPAGLSEVQIQRTMPDGERTILAQYLAALGAAREAIYLENQHVEVPEIVEALAAALQRGVEVALVAPTTHALAPLAPLLACPRFTLAGLYGRAADGRRSPVHVHSKLMIVDDQWLTVGSANLHRFSLMGNAELNAAIWGRETAIGFRQRLLEEHLAIDTGALGSRAALQRFRAVAHDNRRRLVGGEADWPGLAVALDAADSRSRGSRT
ncbi:MAG: phosphatidylserine/phosphatidylglycerophosphate/cardiolipin synthase family protein [Reyranellaceae bacterium]